jgi:hypothetical protein
MKMERICTIVTLAYPSFELHIKLQAATFRSTYLFKMATFLELAEVKLSSLQLGSDGALASFLRNFSYKDDVS